MRDSLLNHIANEIRGITGDTSADDNKVFHNFCIIYDPSLAMGIILNSTQRFIESGWNLSREKKPPMNGYYYVCGWYMCEDGNEQKIHIIAEFRDGQWIKPDVGYQFTYWRELLPFPESKDVDEMPQVMDKKEAIQALELGHRITHRFFQDGEWIEMKNGKIYSEEGVCHDPGFWNRRLDNDAWNTDWIIVKRHG